MSSADLKNVTPYTIYIYRGKEEEEEEEEEEKRHEKCVFSF